VELDVTSAASARAAVEAAVARLGGLHVLVNNAGIDQRGLLEELSEADWDRMLAVNLKGPFLCSLFKSGGLAVEDVVAADLVRRTAAEAGAGRAPGPAAG
jgi:NAD(P)-dependent dehydrogenase (short-subunit alcohol dehydrogenase family)